MKGTDENRKHAGFKTRTRVAEARDILRETVLALERETERLDIEYSDRRVLAESVTAQCNVPHYQRAAMDGYAVRAADTFGASSRSPAVVREASGDRVESGTAARVHTGSELPEGANAVVMIEHAEAIDALSEIELTDAVAEGENVAPIGEDVEDGQRLYEPGHRLRPSDIALLRSVVSRRLEVAARPTVGVVPTGEELVTHDPDPGEIIETNGLTVSRLVERWGGRATYRNIVTDDREALRAAIQRDLTKDAIVTTGGSSVGERDLIPEVVDDLGEVLVHGVGLKPGHPVALGIVEETPVFMLPGYPVACLVNAVQFLRPAISWLQGTEPDPQPTTQATLERKIASEPGTRTFARVRLEKGGDDDGPVATPTRASGAGVLSSVALADGWVVVPESREGIPAGETVAVEHWEAVA